MLEHLQMVRTHVFGLLLFDVFPDDFLVSAGCRYKIASGPKALAREVLLSTFEGPGNADNALALDETNNL